VLHHHANIRKALSDAVKLKLIPYNPAADVERLKLDNFVSAYYNAEELLQVLKLFEGTKMEVLVTLAAYYGLRRSEVVGLR
jgi:integrase